MTVDTGERSTEQPNGQGGHTYGRPPLLSLSDAAKAAGVSRSTLRRRLAEGAFRGAHRDSTGAWVVPVPDLIAAGLAPAVSPPSGAGEQVHEHPAAVDARVAELETALAVERAKRDAAERLATERLDRVHDLRLALRALSPTPPPAQLPPARDTSRRSWWRRRERRR